MLLLLLLGEGHVWHFVSAPAIMASRATLESVSITVVTFFNAGYVLTLSWHPYYTVTETLVTDSLFICEGTFVTTAELLPRSKHHLCELRQWDFIVSPGKYPWHVPEDLWEHKAVLPVLATESSFTVCTDYGHTVALLGGGWEELLLL